MDVDVRAWSTPMMRRRPIGTDTAEFTRDFANLNDVSTDWKKGIPKWMLVTILGLSLSINAFLGAAAATMFIDRMERVEAAKRDYLTEEHYKMLATQNDQAQRQKDQEDAMRKLNSNYIDLAAEVRELTRELRKRGLVQR